MDTTIFDTNTTVKKSSARMGLESLKAANDAYQCGMAVQEHGEQVVICKTADYLIKNENMRPADAMVQSSIMVQQHLNTLEYGGIFKTVRETLNSPETLKA